MLVLQNHKLRIGIKKTGAELCQITSVNNKTEFMWDANPDVWGSYAPNLFPIIGGLKNNTYKFNDVSYNMPKHGFVRHNEDITIDYQTEDSIRFKLMYNDALLSIYPFKFEFYITYTLTDNTLEVLHTVKNIDHKTMYFSVGGHPAFKCPVFSDEQYDDYILEFEHEEHSKSHLINTENGLISTNTKSIFNNTNKLPLQHKLFDHDALIFKDLKSKKVILKSNIHGDILSVNYHDFDYLGIWAKPNGNYVCIEPWLGIADHETTNQDFTTKEGILKLEPNQNYKAFYSIEIHNKHLT